MLKRSDESFRKPIIFIHFATSINLIVCEIDINLPSDNSAFHYLVRLHAKNLSIKVNIQEKKWLKKNIYL